MKKFLIVVMIFCLIFSENAYALSDFDMHNSLPAEKYFLNAIAFSGNIYVTVGADGVILTSSDGFKWELCTYGIYETLLDVIWDGKQFIATGQKGIVLISEDGINWTKTIVNTDRDIKSIAWNGKRYVAVGGLEKSGPSSYSSLGMVFISDDGMEWEINNSLNNEFKLGRIIWDGHQFITTSFDNVLKSVDGLEWSVESEIAAPTEGIIWDGKQYVTVGWHGSIFTSSDLKNWTRQTEANTGISYQNIVWNGKKYVAVGGGNAHYNYGPIFISDDLMNWTEEKLISNYDWIKNELGFKPGNTVWMNDIIWDGSKYIAVGDNGLIMISYDTTNWIKINTEPARITINGQPIKLDPAPVCIQNKILVPLRNFSEIADAIVQWDEKAQSIVIRKDEIDIKLKIGDKSAMINGYLVEMDLPPMLIDNIAFVSLKFISDSLKSKVEWVKDTVIPDSIKVENNKLYRVSVDGRMTKLDDDNAYLLDVKDEWIYYLNLDKNNSLYRIKINGTDRTNLTNGRVEECNFTSDYIYYLDGTDNLCLYRITLDGKNKKKLTDRSIQCYTIYKDNIYYISASRKITILDNGIIRYEALTTKKTDYKLTVMNFDGSANTVLCDDDEIREEFIIVDDWIYYINSCNISKDKLYQGGEIYKIRIDGTDKVRLSSDMATHMIINNGWIYYTNYSDIYKDESGGRKPKHYRMKVDGSEGGLDPKYDNK